MPRKQPEQINFRCKTSEKEAYEALAKELDVSLASIIRNQLNRLVRKHLGDEWLKGKE